MPESEAARLHAVLDTAVDGIILIDSAGIVQIFNPACERLFGYRADEVIGRNVNLLMPSPFHEEHDRYLANYRRTRERKIIGIGREVTGRRKDGSTFPMHLSVGESEHDGQSTFVGIIHDLTAYKKAEQEARDFAGRLQAVVDTAVDGVILIDGRGIVLMFNPACEKLFGYAADEVVARNVKMLMPAPYAHEHDGYLENYRATGQRKIIGIGREVVGRRKDGTTFPMDLSVGEVKQNGSATFVGIIHDLTDRKRMEEQLTQAQKMEAVGQLSGGIAHDFNNLLTVILGNSEELVEQLKPRENLRKLAATIVGAAERGAELTARLLAFSRRQMLVPVEIDCNKLVVRMHELLRRTLHEDIEIMTALAPELWRAFADAGQLESAVLNLAVNARDAMPKGGTLTITTANVPLDKRYASYHPEVKPGNYVLVAVTDDGEGMPPDVLEHVFEPFFTTKDVGKGSGLGLSMVYGFVKQSGGHVSIYSERGLGTTVRLYLPAASGAAAIVQEERQAERVQTGRETVLVVEDDHFVRGYAVACLESLGYRVIAAVDGKEALGRLSTDPEIDLLFSDVIMPGGINGWELVDRARTILPEIKVLLTSGYAIETLSARGKLQPGTLLLNKPYRKAELARRLREAFDAP